MKNSKENLNSDYEYGIIYKEVLESHYRNHDLTDYLDNVPYEVIRDTYYALFCDDLTDERLGIISALLTVMDYKEDSKFLEELNTPAPISFEILKQMYCNHQLTNYLKMQPTRDLESTYAKIIANDIGEDMEGILSGLYTELEYRNQENQKKLKSSKSK